MNKILISLFSVCLSVSSFAQELKCEKNYDQFEKISTDVLKIAQTGSYQQYVAFNDQYDYSVQFRDQHPGQYYWGSDWISISEFHENEQMVFNWLRDETYQYIDQELAKPKLNFISRIGEVCVVPTRIRDVFFGSQHQTEFDVIYVRDLENNHWRMHNFAGNERVKDLKEFFNASAQQLQLSAQYTDGLNYAESGYIAAQKMYESLGIEITPEIKQELLNEKQETLIRLRKNGF